MKSHLPHPSRMALSFCCKNNSVDEDLLFVRKFTVSSKSTKVFNTFFEMLCFVVCFNEKSRVSILHSIQHHFWKFAVQTLFTWIFEIALRARSRPAHRGSGQLLLLRFNIRRSPDSFSHSSLESKLEVLQNVKLKN